MKKLIIIIAALCLSTASFAQDNKETKAFLDKAIAQFEKGGVELNGVVYYGDGSFALTLKMDHERYHASVADFALWFDNQTQWFLRSNEIYVSQPSSDEQLAVNPYLLMKYARDQFDIRSIDSKQLPKGATTGIQLLPRAYSELQNARLFFDKDYCLVSLQANLQNGNTANVEVTSFTNGLKFNDSVFTCDSKNFDAEVIDMR